MGPHGWAADLQTVEQAYAMADMAKADVPADKERGADLRNVGPYGWAANLQTNERPYRSADGAKAELHANAAAYSADVPTDAAAIAVAVRDPDGAAHGSADSGAHRNSVVRAYGGADDRAYQPADGRTHFEANRRTFSGAHGRAYAFTKRRAERRPHAFTKRDADLPGSDHAAYSLAYLSADANSDGRSHGCDATSERAAVAGPKFSERGAYASSNS